MNQNQTKNVSTNWDNFTLDQLQNLKSTLEHNRKINEKEVVFLNQKIEVSIYEECNLENIITEKKKITNHCRKQK